MIQEASLWLKGKGRPSRGFTKDLAGSQNQEEPRARKQPTRFVSAYIKGEKSRGLALMEFVACGRRQTCQTIPQ